MMSRIEQLISEIEEYIDSCKFQALSNSKIIVNKEELEELLVELRLRIVHPALYAVENSPQRAVLSHILCIPVPVTYAFCWPSSIS